MDNQHQKIKGYRDLSQKEIDLMNKIKSLGQELENIIGEVHDHLDIQKKNIEDNNERNRIIAADPARWVAIAKTDFQTGLMALTRAVAQPSSF